MAETAVPSVRGRTRTVVASLLVASATLSGAIVGLIAAVLVAPLSAVASAGLSAASSAELPAGLSGPLSGLAGALSTPDAAVVTVLVGVAVVLDAAALAFGHPRPPAGGRQVPRQWGRLFGPGTVAVLYGARLGVGPLTILSTWTWWAVTVASALMGPASAAAVGATFGLVRMLVVVGVSLAALDPTRSSLFRRLSQWQRPSWATVNGLVALALVAAAAVGCSGGASGGEDGTGPRLQSEPLPSLEVTTDDEVGLAPVDASVAAHVAEGEEPAAGGLAIEFETMAEAPGVDADRGAVGSDDNDDVTTPVTTPAQLEDFVRAPAVHAAASITGTGTGSDNGAGVAADVAVVATPDALADVLLTDVEHFIAIDEPSADRYLDLTAAADLQPDPTEEVALLETRGYQGGWTRAFRNVANDVLVTSVYQFDDAGEAEFYLEDGLITIGGYGGKFFDIEGLSGVRGFAQEFEADGEELRSLGATFQVGPRWHLVYLIGSTETVGPDTLFATVSAQRTAAVAALEATAAE